jgi:hypothetical protein
MEALLEREGQVERWNDDRLDELSQTVKEGFAKSDREMKEGFARLEKAMQEGFAQVDKRFDQVDKRYEQLEGRFEILSGRFFSLTITMLLVGGGVVGSLIATN